MKFILNFYINNEYRDFIVSGVFAKYYLNRVILEFSYQEDNELR